MVMVTEQGFAWARVYRGGRVVCGRARVIVGWDDRRLGLTRPERRYVRARFEERVDPRLRAELAELAERRGVAAQRAAERMEPIEIVVDDPREGPQHIVGRLQPPQIRRPDLRETEFAVREGDPGA
jgi:hypothetical protein